MCRHFPGNWFFSDYLRVWVRALQGERQIDSFKCAQMMDGLLKDKKRGTVLWKSKNRHRDINRPDGDWKPKVVVDPGLQVQVLTDLPSGAPLKMWPDCSPSACFSLCLPASLLSPLPNGIFTRFPGYREGLGVVLILAEKA